MDDQLFELPPERLTSTGGDAEFRTQQQRAAGAREGIQRREDAIARVDAHAPVEWKDDALLAVKAAALGFDLFTADQAHEILNAREIPAPHEPRAMGPVLRRAQTLGWIEPTAVYEPSTRPEANRGPKRVWRSKLR